MKKFLMAMITCSLVLIGNLSSTFAETSKPAIETAVSIAVPDPVCYDVIQVTEPVTVAYSFYASPSLEAGSISYAVNAEFEKPECISIPPVLTGLARFSKYSYPGNDILQSFYWSLSRPPSC